MNKENSEFGWFGGLVFDHFKWIFHRFALIKRGLCRISGVSGELIDISN